jgi:hypothetical protein
LPNRLIVVDEVTQQPDLRKSLDQLDMLMETASRLEKAHKGLLLYLLEDPMSRVVVVAAPPEFEKEQSYREGDDDDEQEEENFDDGQEDENGEYLKKSPISTSSSSPKKPPTPARSGLRMFMFLSVVASAAVAQAWINGIGQQGIQQALGF